MQQRKSPTNKKKEELPSSVKYMQEDVDRLTFETHIRQIMRELLEPILTKSKHDREMIFKIQKNEEDFFNRIDFLEKCVFKKDPSTGATLFDKVEEKILDMDIQIKATMKEFKDQVLMSESKFDDEIFKQNQRLLKIENYDTMIDLNKKQVEQVQFQLEHTVSQIRTEVEVAREKTQIEIRLIQDQAHQLRTMCDNLPPKMLLCESKVKTIEDKCDQLTRQIDETIMRSCEINETKWGKSDQELFEHKLSKTIGQLENDIDKNANHADSLQNWMDIYMPMRLQHQITETIKECLPRKGKYILGIVDQQMQNQLRERMFADVDYPNLKKRCLDVIEELKLEADTLIEENMRAIRGAQENWTQLEAEQFKKEQEQRKQEKQAKMEDVNNILPRAEKQGGGGDADTEALGRLQEQLEQFCIEECEKVQKKCTNDLLEFSTKTVKQLDKLEVQIVSMNNQNTAYVNAIKDEVEQSSFAQRKQNIDTLGLIKGLSSSMKKVKEIQQTIQEDITKIRNTQTISVKHNQLLSSILNLKMGSTIQTGSDSLTELQPGSKQHSLTLTQQMTSNKMNSTQGYVHQIDNDSLINTKLTMLLHDANEHLKKLNVSLFRTNFKKEKQSMKINENVQKSTLGSMTDLVEVDEERETIKSDHSLKKSIKLNKIMQTQLSKQSSIGPTTYKVHQSPKVVPHYDEPNMDDLMNIQAKSHSRSRDIDDATSLNDLNQKLNNRLQPSFGVGVQTDSPLNQKRHTSLLQTMQKKSSNTFRQQAAKTSLKKGVNRVSIPTARQETMANVAQSFDFGPLESMLSSNQQRYNKRGSMPHNMSSAQPMLSQKQSQPPVVNPPLAGWKISSRQSAKGGNAISGSSSGVMNQSFGFGPLNIQKAKYSSQEKIQHQNSHNQDFSFDQYGADQNGLLPKIK